MNNFGKTTRKHSSPGIYFKEVDLTSVGPSRTLGITTLGIAGETLRGPAFQPISIENWRQFVTYFGGTSTAKFKGSKYPKYELPYIAKTYLEESNQMEVCRVLGLSGVNAGPAWVITATKKVTDINGGYVEDSCSEHKNTVIMVLRSRGEHKKVSFVRNPTEQEIIEGKCDPVYEYDGIEYYAKDIRLVPSKSLELNDGCIPGYNSAAGSFFVNRNNYGIFTIEVLTNRPLPEGMSNSDSSEDDEWNYYEIKRYSISLNSNEPNYIYNVIGGNATDGDAEIFVEELYDIALGQLIDMDEINCINKEVIKYPQVYFLPKYENVYDIITLDENLLRSSNNGQRYIYSNVESGDVTVRYQRVGDTTNSWEGANGINGMIYTVKTQINKLTNKREYFYGAYVTDYALSYTPCGSDFNPDAVNWFTENQLNGESKNWYESADDYELFYSPSNVIGNELNSPKYLKIGPYDTDNSSSSVEYQYYKLTVSNVETSGSKGKATEFLTPFNFDTDVDYDGTFNNCVRVSSDNLFYILESNVFDEVPTVSIQNSVKHTYYIEDTVNHNNHSHIEPVTLDFNNYKEPYRYSSTPWIVSELKGSAEDIELHKLFRFHTISDGNGSSSEIKVSIANIEPDNGTFDVIIRDFNDSDTSVNKIEEYKQCTLVPGDKRYIAYMIGSFDGVYSLKSNFVTVEVNEDEITKASIPAGFLGYPVRNYSGNGIFDNANFDSPKEPYFKYNTDVDENIRSRKQYFGISDLVGIDTDVFTYKGIEAYNDMPSGLTPCFHLDARIFNGEPDYNGYIENDDIKQRVTVDGITGYKWQTVSKTNVTDEGIEPKIGTEISMVGTIYEDKSFRKFTVAFYGGWDGWDYYRTYRSNTDEYQYNKYKGAINGNGYGKMFDRIDNAEDYGFESNDMVISTDYYAYLGAIKMLGNPNTLDINVIATPGIDYVNNTLLVKDVIDMVEEDRADALYVVTTPDKPFGAGESESEMYTPQDAVDNLEISEIDSNYTCSYYPWVKYHDVENSRYIYLPPTRDVVKAIAYTDNVKFSWYPNAGWNRGNISGENPRKRLKLNEEDVLYDGRLNFIKSFANEGNKIWGDKNMQILDSQLNRISKRRLLLRIKKLLKNSCVSLLFDPNDNSCSKSLEMSVKSVLDYVKQNRGIVEYKIEIDDSPETREKLMIGCNIYIKPTLMLEYIDFTLTLTPQGVSLN